MLLDDFNIDLLNFDISDDLKTFPDDLKTFLDDLASNSLRR